MMIGVSLWKIINRGEILQKIPGYLEMARFFIEYNEDMDMRKELFKAVKKQYGVIPESPWMKWPSYQVLRHADNRKWFGLVMNISRRKLGIESDEEVDILNIKCDPELIDMLVGQPGFKNAYHMNKRSWLTIILDGSVELEKILPLVDMSYAMTASAKNRKNSKAGPKKWIIPANPKYFDIERAVEQSMNGEMFWKQGASIAAGDIVYLYVAAPYSAIRYEAEVVETDVGYSGESKVHIEKLMRVKILREFKEAPISFDILKANDVYAVRGPRFMPEILIEEINRIYKK